jgi:DNA-binding transcriptional LysR family regulator
VALTAKGEVVVRHARQLLALNDQLLDMAARGGAVVRLRIGIAIDYFDGPILREIAAFREAHPEFNLQICAQPSVWLLRDFRRGEYDLVVASDPEPTAGLKRSWVEPSAWGASSISVAERKGPIPLVVLGEGSLSRRLSVAALERAGQQYEIVYQGGSFAGMVHAAAAGLGIACWSKRCMHETGLEVFDRTSRLPKVADVFTGVHLREGLEGEEMNKFADAIADAVAGAATPSVRQAERNPSAA